jgi:hypothetical protein
MMYWNSGFLTIRLKMQPVIRSSQKYQAVPEIRLDAVDGSYLIGNRPTRSCGRPRFMWGLME